MIGKIVLEKNILLYLIKILELYAAMNGNAICLDDKNNTKCCTNYIYNAEEDRCIECVGRFGEHCSDPCPERFYGASCRRQCNCSSETCHKIWGCLNDYMDDSKGVCYDKLNGSFCCANYIYIQAEHRCQECVGRFGVNCSRYCPRGYYGKQCNEKCSCEANHCDNVLGCLSPTAGAHY